MSRSRAACLRRPFVTIQDATAYSDTGYSLLSYSAASAASALVRTHPADGDDDATSWRPSWRDFCLTSASRGQSFLAHISSEFPGRPCPFRCSSIHIDLDRPARSPDLRSMHILREQYSSHARTCTHRSALRSARRCRVGGPDLTK